jgi:hypothetical protein
MFLEKFIRITIIQLFRIFIFRDIYNYNIIKNITIIILSLPILTNKKKCIKQ